MANIPLAIDRAKEKVAPPKQGGETCVVGCKLPHGLDGLYLYEDRKAVDKEGSPYMTRVVGPVNLLGRNAASKGGRVVAGAGLTEGVDAEFMRSWLKQNEDHPAVVNGLIFMGKTTADARDQAKDAKSIQGIETIDPEHPERHNGPDRLAGAKPDNYEGMAPKDDE